MRPQYFNRIGAARHFLLGGLALLLFAGAAAALDTGEAAQLLKKADSIKTTDQPEFMAIVKRLEEHSNELSPAQRQYVLFFKAWHTAYGGNYETAIPLFKQIIAAPTNLTIRFRTHASMVNVLAIAKRYEEAFSELTQLLQLLPQVTDKDAREQGLGVIALLYNQVGEYELGMSYADKMIQENWAGRGLCKGGELRLEALYKSGKAATVGPEFQAGIDACLKLGELIRANLIRTYVARMHLERERFDDAIKLLSTHYDEAANTRYAYLVSEYNALLAQAHRRKGNVALAQEFALDAVASSVKNEYTERLVIAYRILYELALKQGDSKAALAYHEKYAAADKGYLDDVSARQLAYQRVKHEAIANRLQIDALNKQNQVLQLQRELGDKAVENSRLYIALLLTVLIFIALWAYKTKRSQLYFMKQSQHDGLTGIFNRPHFIERAEQAVQDSRKAHQELCVVLCDLDHFKSINDKYGHAAGDSVLKEAVEACRPHLGGDAIFGRFGGEEFAILLPGASLAEACRRSEQLRLAIAAVTANGDAESGVSASFGVAGSSSSGYELRQLLAHADAALYQAKRAGRNRVVQYDSKDVATASTVAVLAERIRGFGSV